MPQRHSITYHPEPLVQPFENTFAKASAPSSILKQDDHRTTGFSPKSETRLLSKEPPSFEDRLTSNRSSRPKSGVTFSDTPLSPNKKIFSSMNNILEEEEPFSFHYNRQLAQSQGNLIGRSRPPPLPPRDPYTQLSTHNLLHDDEMPTQKPMSPDIPSKRYTLLQQQDPPVVLSPIKNKYKPPPPPPLPPFHEPPNSNESAPTRVMSPTWSTTSSDMTEVNPTPAASRVAFRITPYIEDPLQRRSTVVSPPTMYPAEVGIPQPPRVAFQVAPYRDVDRLANPHIPLHDIPSTDSEMYQILDPEAYVQGQQQKSSKYRGPPIKQTSLQDSLLGERPPPLPLHPPPALPPLQFRQQNRLSSSSRSMAQSLFNLDQSPLSPVRPIPVRAPQPPSTLISARSMGDLLSPQQNSNVRSLKPSAI